MCDLDTGRFTEEERVILQSLSPERRVEICTEFTRFLDFKLSTEARGLPVDFMVFPLTEVMKRFEEQYRGFSEKELMARREDEEEEEEEEERKREEAEAKAVGVVLAQGDLRGFDVRDIRHFFNLPPKDREEYCGEMDVEIAQLRSELDRKLRRRIILRDLGEFDLDRKLRRTMRDGLGLELAGNHEHSPAFRRQMESEIERLQRMEAEEMEEATAAEAQRSVGKIGYEVITPRPSLSPEERATLLTMMSEEDLEYLQGMDATVFHRPDLLVGRHGPAALRNMEQEIEQSQRKEALSESCPVHGCASSPTPYSWSMLLFLLASLAILYCFAPNKRKRAAGKPARARILRLCGRFRWAPFQIFVLYWLCFPNSLQSPQFLEPILTMLLPSFPPWFLKSSFIGVLAMAFQKEVALKCSVVFAGKAMVGWKEPQK